MTRSWKLAVVAGVVVAVAMGVAALSFAHGGDGSRVHACTTAEGEPILLSSANGSCSGRQVALDWAIQGPAGQKGDQGPAGPKGEQGPKGEAGVSATPQGPDLYVIVRKKVTRPPKAIAFTAEAKCPKGFQVVNGGFGGLPEGASVALVRNHPTQNNSWLVMAANAHWVEAWAICYSPPKKLNLP